MLTATEIIEFADGLQVGNYETIDRYLFKKLGFDYWEVPFYHDLKGSLEKLMIRTEVNINGYTQYEWEWRD